MITSKKYLTSYRHLFIRISTQMCWDLPTVEYLLKLLWCAQNWILRWQRLSTKEDAWLVEFHGSCRKILIVKVRYRFECHRYHMIWGHLSLATLLRLFSTTRSGAFLNILLEQPAIHIWKQRRECFCRLFGYILCYIIVTTLLHSAW